MKTKREDVRNIAIIAHVDHGKTTLVDELLKQSGVFRENQEVAERVMDSNDIERERGITILSKNTAVFYKGTKINIVDTPGHADFGGEVERVLKMVNGVILVVDAFEGAMPQTKFVLRKALELDLPVIVCINKIDRPEARPAEVIDEVLELFIDLDASEEQLDCPFIYASAKDGYAMLDMDDKPENMIPLFETILDYIPAPEGDPDAHTQVLISTIDYNEYVGRIGIGKVDNGTIRTNQDVVVVNHHDPERQEKVRISRLYEFDGLNRVEVKEATIGSIVAISGIADLSIGDTICSPENPQAIPFQKISEPTIAMQFKVNDSPFAGREGKYVTSRHLRDRLFRELNTDVSLRGRRPRTWIPLRCPAGVSSICPSSLRTCAGRATSSLSARRRFSTRRMRTENSWSPWRWPTSTCRMNLRAWSSKNWAREKGSCAAWVPSAATTPGWSSPSPPADLSATEETS